MALRAGIHNIPEVLYHADPCEFPSLSNSIIKLLVNGTPNHAYLAHPRLNQHYEFSINGDGSDATDTGSVAHALFLEGTEKARVVKADTWQTKKAKEERALIERAGHIAMLEKNYDKVMGMVVAAKAFVGSSPYRGLLQRAKPEQTIIWRQHGVWHRGRIDLLDITDEDAPLIVDYKSTKSESPEDFMRSTNYCKWGYDTQAELYPQGLQELGFRRPRFLFLVQQSFEPFRCFWVENSEARSELASHKISRARRLWMECLKANSWPGYPISQVFQAEPTKWELEQEQGL